MKVQLITELAAIFRTPLTTIKGSVTALMDSATAENHEARSILLTESLTAIDSLEDIVANLLSMNRLDSGRLKPKKSANDIFDLVSVVVDALRRQSRDYPSSIWIDEDIPLVHVDSNLIVQALTNILLNAPRCPSSFSPSRSLATGSWCSRPARAVNDRHFGVTAAAHILHETESRAFCWRKA